jgi:hypothetical protein
MAKLLLLSHEGTVSRFDFSKVAREKLYGRRVRVPLDPDGERCTRAELTDDGWILLRRGMSAQGYFDEDGTYISSRDLVGLSDTGEALERVPSTLGEEQSLVGPVDPSEVLDLKLMAVYALVPHELDAALQTALESGAIFRFPFNYRADFQAETAFLIHNEHGLFALVGQPAPPEWSALEQAATTFAADEEDDDDLDFEMF